MCDDGLVTISVCKRRHRRSNWKTIAKASLPLPTLLSSPFSGDVLLKKHDADAATITLAITASIIDRQEQPVSARGTCSTGMQRVCDSRVQGLLTRMHGKVKSSIARIFHGSDRSGAAEQSGTAADRVSPDDGSGYNSEVQGYTSDGRAAATLRRRSVQAGARDADGSSDDDIDGDDAIVHGIANVARAQECSLAATDATGAPTPHGAASTPSSVNPDHHLSQFADFSMHSDEGLEEVTAHACLVDSADDGSAFLSWLRNQGNAVPSWSLSLVDALTDHPSHSAASASVPWKITRASLLSSSPSASSSSSGLWVKNCVSQLRALAQPCLPSDVSPLQRLLQLWSCDTAPRILLLVGGDPLFSAALRVIAQSPLQAKITVYLVPLKQSAVAERIGKSCARYHDTFLLPPWLATLSKFGTGSCDEQGHVFVSKIVSFLLDGVHSTQMQVATAVVGAEGGQSKRTPIFHNAEVTCSGDIKLDYWTSAGKKTKLRNVKYPVSLRIASAATGGASLVASVSLGGSKRSVFDRLMTSKKTLVSIDRGVAVTKVLVRSSSLSDQLTIVADGARVSEALFVNVTMGSDGDIECRVACFKPDAAGDTDSAGSLSSAASWDEDL